MAAQFTIGIDLGGTNIKAGMLDDADRLVWRQSIDTESSAGFEHVFARLVRLIEKLIDDAGVDKSRIRGIGIGVPGPMSHKHGFIYGAPNLKGWVNIPIRERLVAATALPVTLENDANAAAFGEFSAGAGRDVRNMVMLTLGTGVGGGIVIDGRLQRGHFDNAGEVGHMIVEPVGRACPCGQRGCLERYSSANAIAERTVEAIDAGLASSLAADRAANTPITAETVENAARGGDALAQKIWDDACRYLAIACINVQHLLNPEQIVLAGGLINAGERLLLPVRAHFQRLRWNVAPDAPAIELATLGTDAGVIGAAALARIEATQ